MKNELINILQIGTENWGLIDVLPDNIKWHFLDKKDLDMFVDSLDNLDKWFTNIDGEFNALVLTDKDYPESILKLNEIIQPYTVFYDKNKKTSSKVVEKFLKQKMYQKLDFQKRSEVLKLFSKILFTGQFGMKYHINDLVLPNYIEQNSSYKGHYYLEINDIFGLDFKPIAFMQYNPLYDNRKILDFFWELNHEVSVELLVEIKLIKNGSGSEILHTWDILQDDLQSPYGIDYQDSGYLAISLFAKGEGSIRIGPIHLRDSRSGLGHYFLGGERHSDNFKQEFMTYFEPGDFKPPLNVYFSGYRSSEGFEGYFMMKKMGAPFLLITDPRLEGGAFYIGSAEFEKKIENVIEEKLKFLGFKKNQLILSGLSMGTYGALYYGTKLIPHAIIVGKPLLNLGTLANNLSLKRPDEFATSLDLLQLKMGNLSDESIRQLDDYFWRNFDNADLSQTLLAIAYMKHDDYDIDAYKNLLEYNGDNRPKVIGKGWIGRHNDNSIAINNWFLNQYNHILKKDFNRD